MASFTVPCPKASTLAGFPSATQKNRNHTHFKHTLSLNRRGFSGSSIVESSFSGIEGLNKKKSSGLIVCALNEVVVGKSSNSAPVIVSPRGMRHPEGKSTLQLQFLLDSVPSPRTRNWPLTGSFRSGFRSSDGISKVIFCSSTLGAEKLSSGASPSESRVSRLVSRGCKLVGCGSAVPSLQISNDDLAKLVDTSDEWISVRTGIRNRRVIAGKDSGLTALAAEAARGALQMAQVDPDDVDLVLMCTSTPEDLFGNAPQIQKALGCKRNPLSYDITAACSGFLLGLVSAACHIRGGGFSNVLVIGADALSRYVDWTDRGTCILFGDAAGAVLLQACDSEDDGLFAFDLHSDGDGQRHLNASIKEKEVDQELGSNGSVVGFPPRNVLYSNIHMNGKEVFRFAVRCVPQSIEAALLKAGLNSSNIDWLLLHQANQRIIDAVATRLEVPSERVISNLANYGNTSAASIPLALDEAVRSGKVKAGHTIATSGFGAGLTWGSAIIRWG